MALLTRWCFWTVVLEKTLENPFDCKEIQPVHPKWDQSWVFIGRTDVEVETPIFRPPDAKSWLIWLIWCWERLKTGREGDGRGWDGWMASLTQWTWVWVNSRSWWWTGRPGVLQSIGWQRVRHDWATELNWTDTLISNCWPTELGECFCCVKLPSLCNFLKAASGHYSRPILTCPELRWVGRNGVQESSWAGWNRIWSWLESSEDI